MRHVLIPLQGSHALISLQSQLHQQGLHNPWYTVTATTQGWFAPLPNWWDYKQLALYAVICQKQHSCLFGTQDQYVVREQTGLDFFLASSPATLKLLIRLYRSSRTTGIDYAWLGSIVDKQSSQHGMGKAKP